jgi:Tfp pilus assembly PilM family ATPase
MLIHINRKHTTMILANANAIKFTATIQIGVDELQSDQKHYAALADELKENINYFHNRLEEKAAIERLVLTGTGALTPNLADFLAKETKLECEVGYPIITLPGKEPIHPRFGTVLGAAMRKKEQ